MTLKRKFLESCILKCFVFALATYFTYVDQMKFVFSEWQKWYNNLIRDLRIENGKLCLQKVQVMRFYGRLYINGTKYKF